MKKLAVLPLLCMLAGAAILIAITVMLWPPGRALAVLLAVLGLVLAAGFALTVRRGSEPSVSLLSDEELSTLSDAERVEHQIRALADYERRLGIREQRLARLMRAQQLTADDFVSVVQTEPDDEELADLTEKDRRLVALIEAESQLAFERILKNRYADDDGVDTALILADVRTFIEKVAKLYSPETANPLLETEIERIAKSLSSTSLHLLMVVDTLPLDLKSYNTAKMYRLLRRSTSYYGTYKAVRPYLEQGLNVLQLARLALGSNPIAVGAAWIAGKITTHGAKALGERMLQRRALQLLNDFIRVIGFEAAMVYGGDFRHRDANWILGAELVNLEVARGDDYAGRDATLKTICRLALRHEFDRIQLLSHLAQRKTMAVNQASPLLVTTPDRTGRHRQAARGSLPRNRREDTRRAG